MEPQGRRRILLVRTDRLGDVVLTTPAIKAVRDAYPEAHIAMIVRPYTELVVRGNPYLDEVIIYDKYRKHKSLMASMRFAKWLKDKNFDRAIIFHPTNRMHIITYLAQIPRRIGYDKKFSFLLTDRIEDRKHEGRKHERDYILDLLKALGIESDEKELFLPVPDKASKYADGLLSGYGIKRGEKIVVMHPGASCPSKIWPLERFAKLADRLISVYGVRVIVIGADDKKSAFCVNSLKKFMQKEAFFIIGGLDIGQLGALIKRGALFVSNDSGPVHIAVAVKTPVVALFGRNQPGLSPVRWCPLGVRDLVIHKDVGCLGICLAHNCRKSFNCLRSIGVDEVFSAIKDMSIL